jgi:carbon-monoxide dehydrogenase large subunit
MDGSRDPKTAAPLVGQAIKRSEDPRLLTGNGRYVDDLQPARGLHVAFVRSSQAHARIAGIESAEAATMPGVVGVFTAADMMSMVKPVRATSRMEHYHSTAIWPLAVEKVRFVGEAVVAVVAESRYQAEDAAEQIFIDYDLLEPLTDPEAAADAKAPLLHEEAGTNILVQREFCRGDVEAVLAAAPVKVGARFRFRRKTALPMENRCYLAEYDAGRRALTLHSSTGAPGIVRDALVEILGMPGNRVRVIAPDVGGSFGSKVSLYPEEITVCALARHLGRPVKWTGDRLEDLISTSQGFDETVYAELALDEQGQMLGLRCDVVGDVGAYSIYPWTAGLEPVQVISFMSGPYRMPAYHGRVRGVATCKAPLGPYRGVGRPASTFVMERLVDMAAHRLGLDPRLLRERNLVNAEEFPYKTPVGLLWDRAGFQESLAKACDVIDYAALRSRQAAAREAGGARQIGIGIACYAELSGIGSRISASPGMPINTGTEICTLAIDPSGAVSASFGIASHGQGLETSLAQIVADELGVRFEDIRVLHGDSAAVSHSTGTYASRSIILAGGAGMQAARGLRQKLARVAAHVLGSQPEHIGIANSLITAFDNGKSISIADLADMTYSQMGKIPKDVIELLQETASYDPVWGTTSASTHVAVVEVDTETCMVKVKDYMVVDDCGRIVNPLIVTGQAQGGVAQGIGAALLEEVVYDENGQILSASLADYCAPGACDVPDIRVDHVSEGEAKNLGGFRGMGEGGTIGSPAAIANAVSDALQPLGIEIHELPITPERLFRLIHANNIKGESQ